MKPTSLFQPDGQIVVVINIRVKAKSFLVTRDGLVEIPLGCEDISHHFMREGILRSQPKKLMPYKKRLIQLTIVFQSHD